MTPEDRPAFIGLLAGAAELYGQAEGLSAVQLTIWWRVLKRFSLKQLEAALVRHCETSKYMPRPSDLVTGIEGSPNDQAMVAWSKVMEAIRRHGSWRSVAFDDPLIASAVEGMGGWVALCSETTQALGFRAKEFERTYTVYLARPPTDRVRYLAGAHETINRTAGYRVHDPCLVGDRATAHALLHAAAPGHTPALPAPQAQPHTGEAHAHGDGVDGG